ncbi:MAG: orotidine-5'-phosphate decarboxylase [Nitrososphaerales archaeon]
MRLDAGGRRYLVSRTGIIHALDIDDLERATVIAKQVAPYVDAIKVSWPSIMELGCKVVIPATRQAVDLPIIADLKVADIPEISSQIVRKAIECGADGITLQGFVGELTMKTCVDEARRLEAYTFIVTEMSHIGAEVFMQPHGEDLALMAKRVGSFGIVAPATRPERTRLYRKIVGPEVKIMSPGIGPQGGELGDAIKAGADFEVIGRRIYNASSPAEEARRSSEKIAEMRRTFPPPVA